MRAEVGPLLFFSLIDADLINNVLFASIFHANVTMQQWDIPALEHVLGIGTVIHDINLGDDTDSPGTLRVKLLRHL